MNWHTETRKISELKNWESNPRTISEESYKELKESINDLGNFEPLVINVDGTVLAGNQRLRIHKERGDIEVEVSVPERELTEEEIKKIGIISNRHSGEWDMDKLANEFEDVLGELGFDDLLPEVELEVKEDDYEEPEDLETTVVLGDVYQLGEHRLMCGDSTKIEDVEKLMNGEKADMVFTDPPYGVEYTGGIQFKGGRVETNNQKMIMNDDTTDIYSEVVPILTSLCDGAIYIWFADTEGKDVYNAIDRVGEIHALIIWVKNGGYGALNANYKQKHEPCLYWCKKGGRLNFNGSTTETTIWELDKDGKNKLHPTQKPVSLAGKAIQNSSREEQKVLDLFGGSGSTLIACEQTNRKCYMMEIDPYYCQVIIDRWEKFTGKKAKKL
jgi:site-specific DNA-methyltransferase (adenine-specific)